MRDDLRDADFLLRGARDPRTRRSLQAFIEHGEPVSVPADELPGLAFPLPAPAPAKAGKKAAKKASTEEDDFLGRIVKAGGDRDWRMYATLRSRQHALVTHAGWPDLFAWHPGHRTFFTAELKVTLKSGATGAQVRTNAELAWCGVRAYVWTPDDWDEIVAVLDGRALPYRADHTAVAE